MSKIYSVEYYTEIDYESDSTSVLAYYTRNEDAKAHLKWIETRLNDFITTEGHGEIVEFAPNRFIQGKDFNGDYDQWEIVEHELQDSFNAETADIM